MGGYEFTNFVKSQLADLQELIRDFMELLVISDFQRHRVIHKLIYRNATTEMQWIGVLMVNNVG